MKKTEEEFCNDQFLQNALNRAEKSYFEKRRKLEKVFDFEKFKDEIRDIKEKNIKNLEENIVFLLNNLRSRGFEVFFAKDSDEALTFFYNILTKNGIKRVVKSKSLTTEEINLNSFLEKNNITPVETDLGEWLVQLNNEKATHMTAPAIHMSKEKILNFLNEKFNANLKLDIKEMVDFCKNEINKEFDNTNCGIFGANAVTKDGTFFIVSNEGNIQHVLNHDINICIVGIDKIVENADEAFKIVSFLPKNATGQVITSWIDVFTKPPGDEFFVILLDNNRSKIAKEEKFDKILNCIKCGACQMACPVYTTVGGQLFRGETYAGPIGVLLSYMEDYKLMDELSFLCSGCMACDKVCSSRIPIQSLILE
ncbi:MAG: LUD domain-containing protein, partial [Thermodesulfobium sp.]